MVGDTGLCPIGVTSDHDRSVADAGERRVGAPDGFEGTRPIVVIVGLEELLGRLAA
jgi:hypothetical protein